MANKDGEFTLEGKVVENLRGSKFKVEVEINDGKKVIVECTLGGKIRINNIRIIPGDKVDVTISSADPTKGRIVWRYR
jgi:translation initiation factor IF-1